MSGRGTVVRGQAWADGRLARVRMVWSAWRHEERQRGGRIVPFRHCGERLRRGNPGVARQDRSPALPGLLGREAKPGREVAPGLEPARVDRERQAQRADRADMPGTSASSGLTGLALCCCFIRRSNSKIPAANAVRFGELGHLPAQERQHLLGRVPGTPPRPPRLRAVPAAGWCPWPPRPRTRRRGRARHGPAASAAAPAARAPKADRLGLLLGRPHRHARHPWPRRRLADRFRVVRPFLPRRTNGLTQCGGTNCATWPKDPSLRPQWCEPHASNATSAGGSLAKNASISARLMVRRRTAFSSWFTPCSVNTALDVPRPMRLRFMRTALQVRMLTTRPWHKMPRGRPPQQ